MLLSHCIVLKYDTSSVLFVLVCVSNNNKKIIGYKVPQKADHRCSVYLWYTRLWQTTALLCSCTQSNFIFGVYTDKSEQFCLKR